MLNFSYSNPTRLVFGRDAELQVGAQTLAVLGGKAKVLVLFGGGSARRTGILDAVEKSLEDAGFCVIEKGGVQPNPRMGFVRETIDWVKGSGHPRNRCRGRRLRDRHGEGRCCRHRI